jgi:serine/threonine-protein kinase
MYMAPEQCEGCSEVDERADIYALGVVLFEMLTGQTPFKGETLGDVVIQKMTLEAPSATSLVPDLPAPLESILRRALAREPAHRFASMQQFREALAATEVATEFVGEVTHALAPSGGRLVNATWRVNTGQRFRRAPMALVIAAVAASALVAVGVPAASIHARAVHGLGANGTDVATPASPAGPRAWPVIVSLNSTTTPALAPRPPAAPYLNVETGAPWYAEAAPARKTSIRRQSRHGVIARHPPAWMDEDDVLPLSMLK